MSRPILLTGDSHLSALRRGADLLPDAADRDRLVFWPLGVGGALRGVVHAHDPGARRVTTTAPVWRNRVFSPETIGAVGADVRLAVSLPLNTSRILREHGWKTHVPWALAAAEFPVSDRVLDAMIDIDSRHALAMLRDLAQVWPDVVVIEAPRFFARMARRDLLRPEVCAHVDAAYRARVGAALQGLGIPVIAQPSATVEAPGMTRAEFALEDPKDDTHTNAAYGALALQDLLRATDSPA
jgi:hypothetical protein